MPAKGLVCEKVTAGELARVIGVSRKHIYELVARGMPRDGRLFDLAQCVQWQLDSVRPDQAEPENLQDARLALYTEQTRKLQLENAKLRRGLVDLEEAKGVLLSVAAVVAGQLDALAARLAPQVLGLESVGEIQDAIFDETREVRRAIASEIDQLDPAGPPSDRPAPAKKRRPVGGRKKAAATRKPRARAVAH